MPDPMDENDGDHYLTTTTPSRKRRRTGKACASCRRRKTRCDGSNPCEACQIGEMTCSYDDPDRKMTAVEYIQSLEKKVDELENLLDRDSSQTMGDLSNPSTPASQHEDDRKDSQPPSVQEKDAIRGAVRRLRRSGKASTSGSDEDVIETMVGASEHGSPEARSMERYRGSFAGLSLLRRVHNLCKHVSATRKTADEDAMQDDFIQAFDFASAESDSAVPPEVIALRPSRESFDQAVDVVLNRACCNMGFLDSTTLEQVGEEVYGTDGAKNQTRRSFALFYAVLALGRRFEPASPGDVNTSQSIRGLRYFRFSKSLLDPTACQDVVSLQALLCMILYTQVSSMMSKCYSFVCIAVAASLQMGLFTEEASKDLPQSEQLCRRRIFSVLNIMDTYVTTALGLPRTLRGVQSDHILPLPNRPASLSDPFAGTYAHAELIQILASAVESNHPVTKPIGQKNGFYGVLYSKITATDEQLEAWITSMQPNPGVDTSSQDLMQVNSQLLLRLAYAHVQMVLYRPFLHHVMRRDSRISLKAYACGSACIKAAMQVVWLAETLESYQLFNEASWFVSFIVSFTAACLVLFVMSNKSDPTLKETEDAVLRIKALCSRHSDQSASMAKCYRFLESVELGEPTPHFENQDPFDAFNTWNTEVSNTFSEAFKLPEDTGLEAQHEDLLQALSLPQLRSFINNRI